MDYRYITLIGREDIFLSSTRKMKVVSDAPTVMQILQPLELSACCSNTWCKRREEFSAEIDLDDRTLHVNVVTGLKRTTYCISSTGSMLSTTTDATTTNRPARNWLVKSQPCLIDGFSKWPDEGLLNKHCQRFWQLARDISRIKRQNIQMLRVDILQRWFALQMGVQPTQQAARKISGTSRNPKKLIAFFRSFLDVITVYETHATNRYGYVFKAPNI
ncbi:hypothetical protein CLF_105848, partial [Clonorchis sinensis]